MFSIHVSIIQGAQFVQYLQLFLGRGDWQASVKIVQYLAIINMILVEL